MLVTGVGFNEDTNITICDSLCVPIKESNSSTEHRCITPAKTSLATTCNVIAKQGNEMSLLENSYSYSVSDSPLISAITPNRGGTAGGTKLTINGQRFG